MEKLINHNSCSGHCVPHQMRDLFSYYDAKRLSVHDKLVAGTLV